MRAGYSETEKTAACITLYLAFCMFVYGFFGFSFYEMLQPRHIANMGLAATSHHSDRLRYDPR